MIVWLVAVLAVLGATFLAIAALGVARMPDVFSRLHAATKAGPVGIASIVLAVAIHFSRGDVTLLGTLLVAFLLLTAPVAAHVIARAAYLNDAPLWEGTIRDDLRRPDVPSPPPPDPDAKSAGVPPHTGVPPADVDDRES
jgi:multicomponent Na+:H+ antiporter subunit G